MPGDLRHTYNKMTKRKNKCIRCKGLCGESESGLCEQCLANSYKLANDESITIDQAIDVRLCGIPYHPKPWRRGIRKEVMK